MRHATNEALESLDLEFVLGDEGLDFKTAWGRSGRQLNVRTCPFCGNDKYKVYINADNGLGNCFAGSCSQGTFNKWQLLQAIYDLTPRDLYPKIEALAVAQGWRPTPKVTPRYDPGSVLMPANTRCADLPAMPRYLLNRGIDVSTATYFDLRYCDTGWFEVKDPTGRIIKQDYSKRIITPIYTLDGTLISFQGRDATGTAEKRYLFPPMFSSTGSALYNIHNWRKGMSSVVITEGLFDAMAVKRALDRYGMSDTMLATASFGMQLSVSKHGQDDQMNRLLELKARGLRSVYMLWDNEPAALDKSFGACKDLLRYGFEPHLCLLDKSKDPGDASLDEIHRAIKHAHPITSELQAMLLQRTLTHDFP